MLLGIIFGKEKEALKVSPFTTYYLHEVVFIGAICGNTNIILLCTFFKNCHFTVNKFTTKKNLLMPLLLWEIHIVEVLVICSIVNFNE